MSQLGRKVETTRLDWRFRGGSGLDVSITEPLVRVLRLSDFEDKNAMGFLFDAMRRARKVIFDNNIWTKEILDIVDRLFINPQNLHSSVTLDDADIMRG
ncbi:hypothetical protein AMTR_s00090p00156810 [Amborella trichopoda]|uniref:Uncharacterized protein n=1 Tax=Amborella trichopoda TaxID=13333 RepID=W1NVN6_AMBTC|nr:hypothetical protein AMTR_s00090p00156810 [Amborella trichopoda]